jgi:hypothetical protein
VLARLTVISPFSSAVTCKSTPDAPPPRRLTSQQGGSWLARPHRPPHTGAAREGHTHTDLHVRLTGCCAVGRAGPRRLHPHTLLPPSLLLLRLPHQGVCVCVCVCVCAYVCISVYLIPIHTCTRAHRSWGIARAPPCLRVRSTPTCYCERSRPRPGRGASSALRGSRCVCVCVCVYVCVYMWVYVSSPGRLSVSPTS